MTLIELIIADVLSVFLVFNKLKIKHIPNIIEMIRFRIFFLLFLFSFSLYAQQETLIKMLASDEIPDCESFTLKMMSEISEGFISGNNVHIDSLLYILDFFCGKSESIQRVKIFNAILNNNLDKEDIEIYLKNDFQTVLNYRKRDSKKKNFLESYNDNIDFYGYLPLNHPIDSIIAKKSKELLQTETVTNDEKFFCILFSSDKYDFERTLTQNEFKNSDSRKINNEIRKQNSRNSAAFVLYSGIYRMIGNNNQIFGNNPYIGLSLSTPLKNKIVCDIGMNLRFNVNDSDFQFKAMENTNTVNSKTTILLDVNAGYKIIDKKRIILLPRIGTGYESTGTGLSEKVEVDGEISYKYHNLNMINFSSGFTVYTPVFVKSYVGLSINYHYCPYHWNKKLITKFNNNSLTCEVVYRF